MKFRQTIAQDLARIARPSLGSFFRWYFLPRGECFPYNVWLRVLQKVRGNPVSKALLGPWVYLVYRHFEFKYGIHGNANVEIGGGLRVVHGPCNLNAARIGRNCTIYPGVTIGVLKGGIPTLGDNVTIWTNAVVCGAITLHDGAVVRALSYVDRDVGAGGGTERRVG